MMNLHSSKHWIMALVTLSVLNSCEGGTTPSVRARSGSSSLDAVPDLTHDELARRAIAAQTEIEVGRAPGACAALLLSEGKDISIDRSALTEMNYVRDAICSLEDQKIAHLLQESHGGNSSSNQGLAVMVEAMTQNGPMKNDLKYNSAKSHEYTYEYAKFDANLIRKEFCADGSAESFSEKAGESFRSIVSGVTLEKYNACVRAKSYGFHCDVAEAPETVTATLRWEPTEMVREVLPIVALDWAGIANLEAVNSLPETLGLGSGYAVSFKRSAPEKNSVVGVTVHDRGRNFNFACRVDVAPAKPVKPSQAPTRKGRFPQCGVEFFKSGEGAVCGVLSYKAAKSPACGVGSFKPSRSRACGVERFNERHDCDICGQSGVFGSCKKCEHPSFGVNQYKECADQSHGIEEFKECEHSTHGVAKYNTCRDASFGVEQYKECEI